MFDFESLYNESHANAFTSAKKRFYDNKVHDLRREDDGGKTIIRAVVHGHREYPVHIVFDEMGGLYDYSCDCYGFDMKNGPCKHILAAALAYEEKNPAKDEKPVAVKRSSDGCVRGLIQTYAKRHAFGTFKTEAFVKLKPIMELMSDDSVALRFVVGRKRMYKIKDLGEFCSDFANSTFRRYGVELGFEHTLEAFDEDSRELVRFLTKTFAEKNAIFGDYSFESKGKDRIKLFPSDLDDFIMICNGFIEVEEGRVSEGMRQIIKELDSLKVTVSVKKDNDGFNVSSNLNEFKLLSGKKFYYVLTSGRIYKVSDGFIGSSYSLIKQLNAHDSVFVSEKDMRPFYNNVLLEAGKFLDIASDTDLSDYLLPPLEAILYLEYDGNILEGKLDCKYAEVDIDIFAPPYASEIRDFEREDALKESLSNFFPYFPQLVMDRDDDIYKLITEGVRYIGRYAAILMSAEVKSIRIRKPAVRVGVKLSGDLLDINVYDDDYTQEELLKIIGEAGKKKYIRLNNTFVDLNDPALKALSRIMEYNSSLTMPIYYAPHVVDELKEYCELSYVEGRHLLDFNDENIEVPTCLEKYIRPYQRTGLMWLSAVMKNGYGGILADDMGLGKSFQIISLILAYKLKTIIVCPTTLILNWENEFRKFAPETKVLCIMGSQEERAELIQTIEKYDVVITSYELIRRDGDKYTMEYDLAILDEAQYIKNPETKNSRAVKLLKSKHRFALTGTPIENSLSELWSIFDFIMPGYLFDYRVFRERFETQIVGGSKEAEEQLLKLVKPFVMRRLKSDVLTELPPKVETDIDIPLIGEQQELYNAHLAYMRKNITSETNKITVLSMLTKLRLLCCDPRLVDPNYKGNSAKLETCLNYIEQAISEGHKILVFSQFTSMLDIIRGELLTRGITNYLLQGDTSKSERMKFVNRFNKDDTKVFLISLKAGGTGLNLMGADTVIHYDPWWNRSVMNQATDRAYRIGQQKSVNVFSLRLAGTLEHKIVELQKRKAKLGELIEGEGSIKDLLELIQKGEDNI